ncbi:MAG: TRAP transporter large permease [Chromatiales bacterium]|jgi:C4-dicarboxylate transporter, DctM subunit|nr:TRAP transporter large permease [Chromatiales bacterium]
MILWASVLSVCLLLLSVPIFLVFGVGSTLVATLELNQPFTTLLQVSFGAITKHVLLSIPLFIFAGLVMLRAGVAGRLVNLCITLVGHLPGGLGIAMVLAMGFFAAFCGSILAAITAVGSILMPTMVEKGYDKSFVVLLAATAGILEVLIPPSNGAIIFSALTEVPVSKTFAAGVMPGFVFMGILILYVLFACRKMDRDAPFTWAQRGQAAFAAIPGLLTPVIILGGIYGGIMTPSESAAAAAVYAILVGFFIHRELTFRGLMDALRATARITTVIFAIIAMATFMSVVLTFTRAPQSIVEYFIVYGVTPLTFLIAVGVICLILGTFLEAIPVIYLTVPVFIGVIDHMNLDILHFYVVFGAFVALGLLTPPVCVGVYTAAAVIKEAPERAFRAVPAFMCVGLVYAGLMIAFPKVATWLPSFV